MATKTIKSAGGDYTSLSAWEAALPATTSAVEAAECYNFDLSDVLGISGITTSAANYIRIYTPTGERHDGRSRTVSGTGFRLISASTPATVLSAQVNHLRLEGLEIEGTGAATNCLSYVFGTFAAGANDHRIDQCIIHDVVTGTGYTINASVANLVLTVRNTVAYGSQRTWDTRNAAAVTSENNTFWRHAAQLGLVSDSELVCKNTYSGHTGAVAEDFWTGSTPPTGNNNASSDTSQATDYTAGVSSVAGSAVFVSVTSGAEDFTLKSGTNALVDAGATLTSTVDLIGTTRPQGSSYDIGAVERASSSAVTGTFAATLDAPTLAATGLAINFATFAATLAAPTMAATGMVGQNATGTLAVTMPAPTFSASGYLGATPPVVPVRPYRWRVMRRDFPQ